MRFLSAALLFLFVCVVLLWPVLAFASTPIDFSDPNVFGQIYEAVKNDNWRIIATFVVIGLNQFIIWIDDVTGKDTWLDKGKWKWAMAILVSILGAVGTKLASMEDIGWGSMISTVIYGAWLGASATGIFRGVKLFKDNE